MSKPLTLSEYHTNLRNIGLFITLAFGTISYSEKFSNKMYKKSLIIIGLTFLVISGLLNITLIESDNKKRNMKLSLVPKILMGLTSILFITGLVLFIK
jgi:hypothetical protein